MGVYNRDSLLKDIKQSIIEVTFIKVNGERRIMRCTLNPRYITAPVDFNHLEEQHQKKENTDIIVCWDVNANGWRSFRIDSVEYVQEVPDGI